MTWPPSFDAITSTGELGTHRIHGVEFAIVEGFRPLLVDVHLPAARPAAAAPAIVYIHGGGWTLGSRRRFGRAFRPWSPDPFERLAADGFVVVAVDYRLSSEARFPAAVHDVKAAVRWMRAHAHELGLDPMRIVAWGESAGGQLALMLGLTGDNAELDGAVGGDQGQRSDVCGVVDWYGVTDFTTLADTASYGTVEALMLGAPADGAPDTARLASPLTHVHAGAPPIQIHHGDADAVVPYSQSVALANALEDVECSVEFVTLPGTDHFWIGAPSLDAIFDASLAFARLVTGR